MDFKLISIPLTVSKIMKVLMFKMIILRQANIHT